MLDGRQVTLRLPGPHLKLQVELVAGLELDLQHRRWFEHADRDLRAVLDLLDDLGAIERDRGMADPVFLDVDLSGGN